MVVFVRQCVRRWWPWRASLLLTLAHQYTFPRLVSISTCYTSQHNIYKILRTMPKKVDVKSLQEQRLARRNKVRKYPPSTVYLQVLGSGASGAPRALYIFTEHARYLFNCGEGTQRLAHEHKVKLSTMEHILITHKSWENVGGLPGVMLTLQDTGVPHITLHGPPGIDSLYYDTRHFLRFRDLSIVYQHYEDKSSADPLIIQNIPLWAKTEETDNEEVPEELETAKEPLNDVEDLFAHEKSVSRKRPCLGQETNVNPTLKRKRQEESKHSKNLSIAYICRPPPKAGALRLEKCVKAGVPPGPLLGELKKGIDVTLADGTVVRAADVTAPDDPGPVFIVVEAPSEAFLDSLLESPAFTCHQVSGGSERDLAEVVVHFTPPEVMAHTRYKEWMARFPASTSHIIINDASTCMGSEAVHRIQYKLNHLSDNLFPLLRDNGIPIKKTSDGKETEQNIKNIMKETSNSKNTEGNTNSDIKDREQNTNSDTKEKIDVQETEQNIYSDGLRNFITNNICEGEVKVCDNVKSLSEPECVAGPTHQAVTLLTYHIRPLKKFDRSSELQLFPESYVQECYEGEKFESALKKLKDRLQELPCHPEEMAGSGDYPCIHFLGTGSCIPNKTRNTSSILVNISSEKAILMDCGEGTYGQLMRLLGDHRCEELLQRLVAVYVSHLHADHHIGLIRLLLARRKAFHRAGMLEVPKLLLLAPSKIMPYLTSYHANFEPILQDFTIVGNHTLLYNDFTMDKEDYRKLCSQLDMKEIMMSYVIHCPNSFGVAWTHIDGWKVVYSGDTMPCKGLIDIGQNCDLLIHEATMEDELEEDAKIKTHCTTSQAIQVGQEMNAHHTLLTHFSQRYAKVPLLDDLPVNVGIAFDNMKVCLKDLPSLHLFYEALVAMFSEDYDEMLEKTAKKRVARERLQAQLNALAAKTEATLEGQN